MSGKRLKLLGVEIDPLTIDDLHTAIVDAVHNKRRAVIANHNMHSVYIFHHDSKMRDLYSQAECIHIDGMPLIVLGRLMGLSLRRDQRVTYVDWVRPLMSLAHSRHFRVFYLGSSPGVADRGAQLLKAEFPGLQIHAHHGYFDVSPGSEQNDDVLSEIRRFDPDVLMVGMGMPRQERWIADNLEHVDARVILTAGACMDYVAGVVPTPPRWMGSVGLEWLYRLCTDPSRLWRRYLVEPWFVLGIFLRERFFGA